MKTVKIYLILFGAIVLTGCDPEFEHDFKGKVVDKENNEPIRDVKLEYSFYPIENWNHWRTNRTERDSITYTGARGQFKINFSTLSMTFDTLKIRVNKEGYREKILVSTSEEWKSNLGFNYRIFKFNFKGIALEKNAP